MSSVCSMVLRMDSVQGSQVQLIIDFRPDVEPASGGR